MPDQRRMQALGQIVDHLVDAMGEPSCPVRRAQVLTYLWANPGSSLNDVMEKLDIDKSTAFRDIDWLIDHGCLVKKPSPTDAREVSLQVFGHALTHLEAALRIAGSAPNLSIILSRLMSMSPDRKQTLREAKILVTLTIYGEIDKSNLGKALYNGPVSTDQRALQNLIDEGWIEQDG